MSVRPDETTAAKLAEMHRCLRVESERTEMAFRERDAAVQEAGKLREALQATEDDALALLDQHVSPEVHKETRLRIIERIQARDER